MPRTEEEAVSIGFPSETKREEEEEETENTHTRACTIYVVVLPLTTKATTCLAIARPYLHTCRPAATRQAGPSADNG